MPPHLPETAVQTATLDGIQRQIGSYGVPLPELEEPALSKTIGSVGLWSQVSKNLGKCRFDNIAPLSRAVCSLCWSHPERLLGGF